MTRTVTHRDTPRTDQRFVAEAVTETGVNLRGESEWKPAHWDREGLRREAESDLRDQLAMADRLNVEVGPIRITRETRETERLTITYTRREHYADVTPTKGRR